MSTLVMPSHIASLYLVGSIASSRENPGGQSELRGPGPFGPLPSSPRFLPPPVPIPGFTFASVTAVFILPSFRFWILDFGFWIRRTDFAASFSSGSKRLHHFTSCAGQR